MAGLPADFSVCTYNLFAGEPYEPRPFGTLSDSERLLEQIRHLRSLQLDVICLQEAYCPRARALICSAFSADYHVLHYSTGLKSGQRIHRILQVAGGGASAAFALVFLSLLGLPIPPLFAVLVALLTFKIGTRLFLTRPIEGFLLGQSYGLVTLVRKQFAPVIAGFEITPFKCQTGDWTNLVVPRACLAVRLSHGHDSEPFLLVLNAHLNALGDDTHRAEQAAELGDEWLQPNGGPVILCGDLNCGPGSAPYDMLTVSLVDPCHGAAAIPTWMPTNPYSAWRWRHCPPAQVDHILHQGLGMHSIRFGPEIYNPPLGDHYALVMRASSRPNAPIQSDL